MHALGDYAAGGRDYLIIILDFLTLVHERGHGLLATFVNEDGSDGKYGFGVEVLLRISHSDGGIDVSIDYLKDGRVADDLDILSQLGHLLGGGTGGSGDRNDHSSKDSKRLFHKISFDFIGFVGT
jgi:hypothetical protein